MAQLNRGWTMIACVSAVAAMGAVAGLTAYGRTAASATSAKAGLPMAQVAGPIDPGPIAAVPDCIYGISKDVCEGRLKGEREYTTGCDTGTTPCRTYHLDEAAWEFPLVSSNLRCATNDQSRRGLCDELGDRSDGRFVARVNLALREQEPCRFRGTIDGEATYYMNDGSVYEGKLIGVIGVGADRTPACSTDAVSCEDCLDIQWINNFDPGSWRFGVEVIFDGRRTDIANGERVRLNISGNLNTPGGVGGPDRLNAYRFIGTADGMQIGFCH
jgi:hypothetical protein